MRKRLLLMLVVALTVTPFLSAPAEAGDNFRVRVFGAWTTSGADQSEVMSGFPGGIAEIENPTPPTDPLFYIPALYPAAVPAMQTDPGNGPGFGASFEWKFAKRWGIELGAMKGTMDSKMDFLVLAFLPTDGGAGPDQWQNIGTMSGEFDLEQTQATLGVNWHLFPPEKKIDFFVGLYGAWLGYKNTSVTILDTLGDSVFSLEMSPDDGTGFGLNVGFDWRWGNGPWMLTGALKYTDTRTDIEWVSDQAYVSLPQPLTVDVDPLVITLGIGAHF